jgi:hypothetical protein
MSIKTQLQQYSKYADDARELENQIAVLTGQKKDIESEMSFIKKDLESQMIMSGQKKAQIDGWRLSISESTSTIVEEPDLIPEQYFRIKKEPDLFKIKAAMKLAEVGLGEIVEGVLMVKSKNLSLKKL